MSERTDGSMRYFEDGSEPQNVENRKVFFRKNGIESELVIVPDIVHGNHVITIDAESKRFQEKTDALVTSDKGIYLSVTVADCLPILFYDPIRGNIGIAHMGWRGALSGVVTETMSALIKLGSDARNVSVAIGPCIQKCHFEILKENAPLYKEYAEFVYYERAGSTQAVSGQGGKVYVDLPKIASKQLEQAGIPSENINASDVCTFCEKEKWFSYRRDKPEKVQAMVAVIGMR